MPNIMCAYVLVHFAYFTHNFTDELDIIVQVQNAEDERTTWWEKWATRLDHK